MVGSGIGTGVFALPSSLATSGPISLVAFGGGDSRVVGARLDVPLAYSSQGRPLPRNGPPSWVLAADSQDDDESLSNPFPVDVLGAQTQGMFGYWFVSELAAGSEQPMAAVVTQTIVDPADSAFVDPTKFIGRHFVADPPSP